MRIGIFETEHFEGIYPVIRLFDTGDNEIIIFSYEGCYRQLQFLFGTDAERFQWIVRKKNENKYRFIIRIYRESKKRNIDLLYLNTLTDNHIFYSCLAWLLRKIRVIVTLHDINGYFNSQPAHSFRTWLRKTGKKWLIRVTREFNVVSDTMVSYLQNKLPSGKQVHNLPGAIFELTPPLLPGPADSGTIKMVIPGTIDGRRRDYEVVFDLLEKCNQASLPVTITLLGGHYGKYGEDMLERCRSYSGLYNNLLFYQSDIVDQPEFDRVMNDAHIVFMPSVIDTVLFDNVTETYGLSISSGNIFDVIKHAKPFIVPAALMVPGNLESSCIRYKTVPDICIFLQRIMKEPDYYRELVRVALDNSGQYTIPKVRERNPTLFEKVC